MPPLSSLITTILPILSLLIFFYGFTARSSLSNAGCCDMTYSSPVYSEIPNSEFPTSHPPSYKLYHYADRRNPPTPPSPSSPSPSSPFCNSAPILFVPGHWGQYEQGRSFGSHGRNRAGRVNTPSPLPRHVRDVFETYLNNEGYDQIGNEYSTFIVDFGGEGGLLHASKLARQSDFLVSAIKFITSTSCPFSPHMQRLRQVTLVGHSVGGLIARSVFSRSSFHTAFPLHSHPNNDNNNDKDTDSNDRNENGPVKTIITLATPHKRSPVTLDESVSRFYREVNEFWSTNSSYLENVILLSLSGSFRDEMVPSALTSTTSSFSHPHTLTLMASDIMQTISIDHQTSSSSSSSSLLSSFQSALSADGHKCGLDHRAIVWCSNLLHPLKHVILFSASLAASDASVRASERVSAIRAILNVHDSTIKRYFDFDTAINEETTALRSTLSHLDYLAYNLSSNDMLDKIIGLWVFIGVMKIVRFRMDWDGGMNLFGLVVVWVIVWINSSSSSMSSGYDEYIIVSLLYGTTLCAFKLFSSILLPILRVTIGKPLAFIWNRCNNLPAVSLLSLLVASCIASYQNELMNAHNALVQSPSAMTYLTTFTILVICYIRKALDLYPYPIECVKNQSDKNHTSNMVTLYLSTVALSFGKCVLAVEVLSGLNGDGESEEVGRELYEHLVWHSIPVVLHLIFVNNNTSKNNNKPKSKSKSKSTILIDISELAIGITAVYIVLVVNGGHGEGYKVNWCITCLALLEIVRNRYNCNAR